jgi:hypothetical protein
VEMPYEQRVPMLVTTVGNMHLFLGFVSGHGASTHERLPTAAEADADLPPWSAARHLHRAHPMTDDRSVRFRATAESSLESSSGFRLGSSVAQHHHAEPADNAQRGTEQGTERGTEHGTDVEVSSVQFDLSPPTPHSSKERETSRTRSRQSSRRSDISSFDALAQTDSGGDEASGMPYTVR